MAAYPQDFSRGFCAVLCVRKLFFFLCEHTWCKQAIGLWIRPIYTQLYSPKMVAIRKQNENLTNLTKMLRNSPQFTTIIQYTEHHHHTHSSLQ